MSDKPQEFKEENWVINYVAKPFVIGLSLGLGAYVGWKALQMFSKKKPKSLKAKLNFKAK